MNRFFYWWSSPYQNPNRAPTRSLQARSSASHADSYKSIPFVIEHIYRIHECINQAFLKITVCWIAMTELLKSCRHLFAGQLWLLQFGGLDIRKDFFFPCFQLIKPLFSGRRENALLDCFQNVSNGGLGFRKL